MQARLRVAPVVLIDSACLYSYQRALADLVFPRPLAYSVSLARRTQPLAGRHHDSCGTIHSGIAAGAKRRFRNCGREPLEANVPGTCAWIRYKSIPWVCRSTPLCFCRRGLVLVM